ncbi:MAG TPA: hypothetical protein VGQ99_01115 [Tepidisphaeraceae bacterium]|jgi:hypothetical protein|nr:hypothetical protein [Tepidisphaeraceae bacterium]
MMRLTPDMFREAASDPVAWRAKAVTLRGAAQSLWESFDSFFRDDPGHLRSKDEQATILYRYSDRIHTSQLLYGLATETALKGHIIQADPASIEFREKKDGDGNVVDLQILKIGVELGKDGHDLLKLGEAAGVLDPGNATLFLVESDLTATREILAYLTDCVRWSGRYPAPKKLSERYLPTASIPSRVLGLYMRDWLDPFLDALLPNNT